MPSTVMATLFIRVYDKTIKVKRLRERKIEVENEDAIFLDIRLFFLSRPQNQHDIILGLLFFLKVQKKKHPILANPSMHNQGRRQCKHLKCCLFKPFSFFTKLNVHGKSKHDKAKAGKQTTLANFSMHEGDHLIDA